MAKATIASIQSEIATLRELREGDRKHMEWQSIELNRLRGLVTTLEADKKWLQQMHSAILQATAQLFRNRN